MYMSTDFRPPVRRDQQGSRGSWLRAPLRWEGTNPGGATKEEEEEGATWMFNHSHGQEVCPACPRPQPGSTPGLPKGAMCTWLAP